MRRPRPVGRVLWEGRDVRPSPRRWPTCHSREAPPAAGSIWAQLREPAAPIAGGTPRPTSRGPRSPVRAVRGPETSALGSSMDIRGRSSRVLGRGRSDDTCSGLRLRPDSSRMASSWSATRSWRLRRSSSMRSLAARWNPGVVAPLMAAEQRLHQITARHGTNLLGSNDIGHGPVEQRRHPLHGTPRKLPTRTRAPRRGYQQRI